MPAEMSARTPRVPNATGAQARWLRYLATPVERRAKPFRYGAGYHATVAACEARGWTQRRPVPPDMYAHEVTDAGRVALALADA